MRCQCAALCEFCIRTKELTVNTAPHTEALCVVMCARVECVFCCQIIPINVLSLTLSLLDSRPGAIANNPEDNVNKTENKTGFLKLIKC